jgi:hypothetical protein
MFARQGSRTTPWLSTTTCSDTEPCFREFLSLVGKAGSSLRIASGSFALFVGK